MKAIAYSITFVGALFGGIYAGTNNHTGLELAACLYVGVSFVALLMTEAGK